MSKHTPAPWFILSVKGSKDNYVTIDRQDGTPVAIVFGENNEQQDYNARLIAAAPELLEALQYYEQGVDHFYKCIDFGKSRLDGKAIQFMNESNLKITAALRKAIQSEKEVQS